MQGLDTKLALTTTATTAKTKNVSINQTGEIRCGGIAHYGKVVIDMRLIDADALEKEGWSLHRTVRVDRQTSEYQVKQIAEVPTIEPERTGTWIVLKRTKHAMCSECRRSFADVYDLENWDHYCRHCGTVMKSIVAEEEWDETD